MISAILSILLFLAFISCLWYGGRFSFDTKALFFEIEIASLKDYIEELKRNKKPPF